MDSSRDAVGRMRECGNLGCHRLDSLWTRTNHPARRIEIDVSGGRLELARDQSQQRSFAGAVRPDYTRPSSRERERDVAEGGNGIGI